MNGNADKSLKPACQDQVEHISKRIKQLRRERGLTVQELAYRCDMERSNVSRIESGRSNPTLRTLCVICRALEISLGELVE